MPKAAAPQLRLVKTGGRIGDRIRVLAGLTAGESVVIAPPSTPPRRTASGDQAVSTPPAKRYSLAGRLAAYFVESKLTPIAIIVSIALGLFAVLMLPR